MKSVGDAFRVAWRIARGLILASWQIVSDKVQTAYDRWINRVPSPTSTKWLSSRRIRQAEFSEILLKEKDLFDQSFFDSIDKTRSDYDKIFWRAGYFQFTLTAFLVLYLLSVEVSLNFLGFSSDAIGKLAEFILLAHGVTIGYTHILQQYVHKLEDLLFPYARLRCKDKGDEVFSFYALRYASPVEASNINFLPSNKHVLYHNRFSKFILLVHAVTRALMGVGFAAIAMFVPLLAAISIARDPNYGLLSYMIVVYWFAVGTFSVAAMLIHLIGVPFTDFSYTKKLVELKEKDPQRHQQVLEEVARTGKWPSLD